MEPGPMTTRAHRSDLVDIAGELRHETERAFLLFDGARTVWLPKSQVEHHPQDGVFVMPEWLAKEKELI